MAEPKLVMAVAKDVKPMVTNSIIVVDWPFLSVYTHDHLSIFPRSDSKTNIRTYRSCDCIPLFSQAPSCIYYIF